MFHFFSEMSVHYNMMISRPKNVQKDFINFQVSFFVKIKTQTQ